VESLDQQIQILSELHNALAAASELNPDLRRTVAAVLRLIANLWDPEGE